MSNLHRQFQGADRTADTAPLVEWLELADAAAPIQAIKRQMLTLGPVREGDWVLDIGCGVGLEAIRLARRVGSAGRVVGVDISAPLIAEARRRLAGAAVPVKYAVMDVRRLDFPDGAFDLCRTERVLRYVVHPEQALREMARVVRPGGRVVVFDFDSDATVVDASDPALARRVREILDTAVPNSWIGRQLPGLLRQAGLVDVIVSPQVVTFPSLASYRRLVQRTLDEAARNGRLAAADVDAWWADLEQADHACGFFAANLGFIVSGRTRHPGEGTTAPPIDVDSDAS
jgi:ubiquinone/menaquinone biosynthesis C-methylase UbiE